ncbi:hypothetical protein [Acinetobacter brisouii]|uniref:hypothetical protein n=1 Tax=Acinetobacter brisouii TaxID=396323 RepID=UPI00125016BF|nr:hypothetical protein [Acinetobacter brisouii]
MSSENKTSYKLNFINESEFEIVCEDKGETLAIKHLLDGSPYVSNILPTFDLDQEYPDKITGETTNQDELILLLKEWDTLLKSKEVTTYRDFDKE